MNRTLGTAMLLIAGTMAGIPAAMAEDYGIPEGIQEGNILHCFNWPAKDVMAELPSIAAAGFGSVQISPCQRADIQTGSSWHDLYRPYDLAFKSSSYCSEQDLKDLCTEAAKYGIKIIVDVVANHVDKTAGYHDPWWDGSGYVRWNGGINYGDRYSITHGQLGDYGDINSENSDVQNRAKSYVEKLKELGVKGIRWDAAKHIGLPSEGCGFWSTVTSVPGMFHYGEILDAPGPNAGIIKEYTEYMSVTDNKYCNYAARNNSGIPGGYGGDWAVNYGVDDTKLVYWAESHDTYSNDEWSQNVDQSTIDRAYAAYASRNGATALYLSRPNTKGFSNIKVGKGSTAFKSKSITEVNKFRNAMTGRADWFEANGDACSITRDGGGAVIVMKGSGSVSVVNGGGYCPAGTYTDRVSGGTFTVTGSTISGSVGTSGIAVIYSDEVEPAPGPNPNPDPDPTPDPTPDGELYILGNLVGAAGWSATPGTGVKMTADGAVYTAKGVEFVAAAGETRCYLNLTDYVGATWDDLNMNANRYGAAEEGEALTSGTSTGIVKYAKDVDASGCLSWTVAPGVYDVTADLSTMQITLTGGNEDPNPNPNPDPDPDPDPTPDPTPGPEGKVYIYFDNTDGWAQPNVWAWTSTGNCTASMEWPGDALTLTEDGLYYWELPEGKPQPEQLLFIDGNKESTKTSDLKFVNGATYKCDGSYTVNENPDPTPDPNPDPEPDPTPDPTPDPEGKVYIYFDNTDGWAQPNVWAWTSTGNCTASMEWPGDALTLTEDGLYYWELPEGKPQPEQLLFIDGNKESTKTSDLKFVNGATYKCDGSYTVNENPDPTPDPNPNPDPEPDPTPDPTPGPLEEPTELYVIGNIEGAQWDTAAGEPMERTEKSGVWRTIRKVKFVTADADETYCYFNLATTLGSGWDAINASNRFGSTEEGVEVTLSKSAPMKMYVLDVDASACKSWTVKPGAYYVVADFNTGTVSLAESTGIEMNAQEEEDAIYFTLDGIRVEDPVKGLYIKVTGNKVAKVNIR